MIFLSAADTEAVFDWRAGIGCMRTVYAAELSSKAVPGRLVAVDRSAWIRCMPAIPPRGAYMGVKQISRTREGKLAYLITLFDKESGEVAYLIDGISITAMRTASTSAAALDALSKPGPIILGVIGSGVEARNHVLAIASMRPIASLAVYSPTPANREAFASEIRATLNVDARPTETGEQAVRGASHVVGAARSRDESPTIFGEWLESDAVVISVGSTTPSQREIDVSVVERAGVIVSDVPAELSEDTGDMIAANAAGIDFATKLYALQDLLQERIPPDRTGAGIRLFKSVGSALQDVAFAEHIAVLASGKGLGARLNVDLRIKQSIGRNS